MFTIIIFALAVLGLGYFFYFRRRRESAAFREASFADFVEFDRDRSVSTTDNSVVNEIAAGVISAAAASIEQRKTAAALENPEETGDYHAKARLYDEATRSLLTNLYQVIGDDYLVLHRVPVADLVNKNGSRTGLAISAGTEKVDFVICQRADLKAVCCIQHSGGGIEKLLPIFRNSGLPFLQFAVGIVYSEAELRHLLGDIVIPARPVGQCRNCQQAMVVKRVSRGRNEGQYFWVCGTCKLNVPVR